MGISIISTHENEGKRLLEKFVKYISTATSIRICLHILYVQESNINSLIITFFFFILLHPYNYKPKLQLRFSIFPSITVTWENTQLSYPQNVYK